MNFDDELQAYLNGRKNPRKETVMPAPTHQQEPSLQDAIRNYAERTKGSSHEWF